MLPFTSISSKEGASTGIAPGSVYEEMNTAGTVRNGPDSCYSPQQNHRLNRFTPTPWHEVNGDQVRYELPKTLQGRIREAVRRHAAV